METTVIGYVGTTRRIIPSFLANQKVRLRLLLECLKHVYGSPSTGCYRVRVLCGPSEMVLFL